MQCLKLLVGYVPRVDRLPPEPRKFGLTCRVALIMDTHRPYDPDAFFDEALYTGLMNVVRTVVGGDRLRVVVTPRETYEVVTSDDFRSLVEKVPESEREPFSRVTVLRGSSVAAIIESEPWAHIGGPTPYNDSYTLAVFTASDISQILVPEVRAFCEKGGCDPIKVISGTREPVARGALDIFSDVAKSWRKLLRSK